jgi:glycosyltransferase involved in cell wall biosynthesis
MTRRTIFVDETSEIGGAEVILATTAKHLKKAGWRPSLVIPREGPLADLFISAGIPVHKVPGFRFRSTSFYVRHFHKAPNPLALVINAFIGLIWVLRLRSFFRRSRPAIVHTVSMWSHIFAGLAARLAGCPVVWHFQEITSLASGFGMYRRLLVVWARYIPTRIVCLSEKIADQFANDVDVRDKVSVLWPIVDIGKFIPAKRVETSKNDHINTVGTVARLTPWKGQEVALRTARILKDKGVQFRWLFAGDVALGSTKYRDHLCNLIRQWDLDQNVKLIGWVEDMPHFYRSLDALVHVPIEAEPFGLVLAEAMASGLPVISTSGGGMEKIIEAAGGILIPPNQPNAIADTLIELWNSPQDAIKRGKIARCFAEQTFSTEKYTQQWIDVYESL